MLRQVRHTIAAEKRDFPEWHHGRKTYAAWILRCDAPAIQEKFEAARIHLAEYLLEPYRRQPHITLFVCGFLVDEPQYNDDFTPAHLNTQIQTLERTHVHPCEIEIGGLNSFASAPFLEVHDLAGCIQRLRKILATGAPEFRTAPYIPHLTIGLYAESFSGQEVLERMAVFSSEPVRLQVERITLATYRAEEFAGRLRFERDIEINIPHRE